MLNTTQKALYDILKAVGFEVYDIIPEGVEMPFIKLGDTSFNEIRSKYYEAYEVTQQLELWTDATGKGRKETNEKVMTILNALKQMPQDMENYFVHDLTFQNENAINEVMLEDTTVLFQSIIQVTFKLEQKGA